MSIQLKTGEVHIWTMLDDDEASLSAFSQFTKLLSPEEQHKLQQYSAKTPQRQFLITRGMLRLLLSDYQPQIAPNEWSIEIAAQGKPYIHNPLNEPLHFSISHTKGLLAIAFCQHPYIGLDIENQCRKTKVMDIATHFFSSHEVAYLKNMIDSEQQTETFFKIWTLKESLIKATGKGISVGLDKFSMLPTTPLSLEFHQPSLAESQCWQLWQEKPTPHHQMAVAIGAPSMPDCQIILKEFAI